MKNFQMEHIIVTFCCKRNWCLIYNVSPATSFTLSNRRAQRHAAHRARVTIAFLQAQTPDFILPYLWPPNSADLNPVDYAIWVCCSAGYIASESPTSMNSNADWWRREGRLKHSVLSAAVEDWWHRLNACVDAGGGHFK